MGFDEKVVLVTGASSGIGADAAVHLAKLGAKVAIVGRNEKRLNEVAEQIKKAGATPLPIVGDVVKDAERIVNETIKHFGKLDVLVNNAGILVLDTVDTMNISEFDRQFNTNLRSSIVLTLLCIPHLEKTKGNVVNVSSMSGFRPINNMASYCITKAAMNQFTQVASLDLGPKGIRVNAINPAVIKTPLLDNLGVPADTVAKLLDESKKKYPVGRLGEVHDTSAAIAYLADNELSSFITGTLLPVDGGALQSGVTEL